MGILYTPIGSNPAVRVRGPECWQSRFVPFFFAGGSVLSSFSWLTLCGFMVPAKFKPRSYLLISHHGDVTSDGLGKKEEAQVYLVTRLEQAAFCVHFLASPTSHIRPRTSTYQHVKDGPKHRSQCRWPFPDAPSLRNFTSIHLTREEKRGGGSVGMHLAYLRQTQLKYHHQSIQFFPLPHNTYAHASLFSGALTKGKTYRKTDVKRGSQSIYIHAYIHTTLYNLPETPNQPSFQQCLSVCLSVRLSVRPSVHPSPTSHPLGVSFVSFLSFFFNHHMRVSIKRAQKRSNTGPSRVLSILAFPPPNHLAAPPINGHKTGQMTTPYHACIQSSTHSHR